MTQTLRAFLVALSFGAMTMPLDAQTPTPDLSGITALRIQGQGSRTVVIADAAVTPGINVTQKSNVFCQVEPAFTRQGDTLIVEIQHRGFLVGFKCDATVNVTMPAGIAVAVDQPQAVVELKGLYSDIAVATDKLVLTLDGGADSLRVKADKAVITADFTTHKAGQPPVIDIAVPTLVANVGYPRDMAIEYTVDAPVAVFSRGMPQTPGADGRLTITSQLLKGALYPVPARS